MTAIYVILILGLFRMPTTDQHPGLTVVVHQIRDGKGMVRVAIYDSEKDFMKVKWKSRSVKAAAGDVEIILEDIPSGVYAISVMHDANENDKLDSNAVGVPKEGFGFSNNVLGTFGPPDFAQAKFVREAGSQKIEIFLKYY